MYIYNIYIISIYILYIYYTYTIIEYHIQYRHRYSYQETEFLVLTLSTRAVPSPPRRERLHALARLDPTKRLPMARLGLSCLHHFRWQWTPKEFVWKPLQVTLSPRKWVWNTLKYPKAYLSIWKFDSESESWSQKRKRKQHSLGHSSPKIYSGHWQTLVKFEGRNDVGHSWQTLPCWGFPSMSNI